MSGYYPESAEKDPNAPWNDMSPDYWCDCGWDSNGNKNPTFLDDDGDQWACPNCGVIHVE